MQDEGSTGEAGGPVRPRWDRRTSTAVVAAHEDVQVRGASQREFAASVGVPRSTLRYWLSRKAGLDADPELVAFLESPTGLAFLHRLLVALHFLFVQVGLSGVDLVCTFLELTRLDAFVAASHGEQHGVAAAMTDQIIAFGQAQRRAQAGAMPKRVIALAEDETFPEGVCLVAMNPVSGYIVLEEEAPNREAATWTARVQAALADLWVEVRVAGGDEALGLAAHATQIGAHHAPDVFHVQHPLWQALVQPLVASLAGPAARLEQAVADTATWREHLRKYQIGPRPVGHPPGFARHIAAAEAIEAAARAAYEAAVARRDEAYAAIRRLGSAYHPVDPTTGLLRLTDTVAADLNAALTTLRDAATAIDLSDKRRALIEKAGRVVPKMVETVAFFYAETGRQLDALALPAAVRSYAEEVLLPAAYLARLAERAATVAERTALLTTRLALLNQGDPAVQTLFKPYQWQQLERVVLTCVDLFVRSSSCVEGRNGRLALWHHHLHRLSARRLTALTVIHNYWIKRPDGSTAADRFFEVPHDDLFDWLLDHMDLPARPAVAPARARAA